MGPDSATNVWESLSICLAKFGSSCGKPGVYLDIPSMRHAITIYDTQAPVDGAILGRINYVEMNERYVILCGSQQLRIFSRSPQGALLYHIPASKTTYAKSALDLPDDYEHGTGDMVLTPRATSARFNDLTAAPETLRQQWST